MGPAERRDHIVRIVYKSKRITVVELAQIFDVSERTIQRDIEAMTQIYPIYTTSGREGGVRLVEGFSPYRVYMTDEEIAVLNKALQIVDANPDIFTPEDRKILVFIIKDYTCPTAPKRKERENHETARKSSA